MILEILSFGFGGAGFVLFIAHCAGASWNPKAPRAENPDEAVTTLKEMEL